MHADTQFQSVSAGAGGKVWVVAKDGSAFLRHGITETAPTGQLWLHVPQPAGGADFALRLASVGVDGGGSVWAVDAGNRLHRRQEVTHVFPEGSAWTQVATGVRAISASASGARGQGELWAVLESATAAISVSGIVTALQVVGGVALDVASGVGGGGGGGGVDDSGGGGVARGVLARRSGITPDCPLGTGWDIAIGVSHIHRDGFFVPVIHLLFTCIRFREAGSRCQFGERCNEIGRFLSTKKRSGDFLKLLFTSSIIIITVSAFQWDKVFASFMPYFLFVYIKRYCFCFFFFSCQIDPHTFQHSHLVLRTITTCCCKSSLLSRLCENIKSRTITIMMAFPPFIFQLFTRNKIRWGGEGRGPKSPKPVVLTRNNNGTCLSL